MSWLSSIFGNALYWIVGLITAIIVDSLAFLWVTIIWAWDWFWQAAEGIANVLGLSALVDVFQQVNAFVTQGVFVSVLRLAAYVLSPVLPMSVTGAVFAYVILVTFICVLIRIGIWVKNFFWAGE